MKYTATATTITTRLADGCVSLEWTRPINSNSNACLSDAKNSRVRCDADPTSTITVRPLRSVSRATMARVKEHHRECIAHSDGTHEMWWVCRFAAYAYKVNALQVNSAWLTFNTHAMNAATWTCSKGRDRETCTHDTSSCVHDRYAHYSISL